MKNKRFVRTGFRKLRCVLGAAMVLHTLTAPPASSAAQDSQAFTKALEKGEALMEQGKCEKAIRPLKKAEALSREPSARILLYLAICSNRVGEFENAESYARATLEVADDLADQAGAYNMLGLSVLWGADRGLERLQEAEAAFRKVLALTSGQANIARYSLGEVLKRQRRPQEAHTVFAEYLERQPDGERSAQARRAMESIACVQNLGPIPVEGEVKPPVKISGQLGQYTEDARKARIQGVVIAEMIIDKNGAVRCLTILEGLPFGLTQAAAAALSVWKFKPATLHGEPVAVFYMLATSFRLE